MKSFLTASLALVSCAVFAGVQQDFDNVESDALPSGWTGDGSIVAGDHGDDHGGNMLSVDGKVTCDNTDGTASRWSKLSLWMKAPEEATDLASEDIEMTAAQFAVATGAEVDGALKVMVCQKKSGAESEYEWVDTGKTVAKGAWFAVNLEFDYGTQKVRVMVGNEVCDTEYDLVSSKDATDKIASLDVIGSSNVDDVSIQEAVAADSLTDVLKGYKIYLADIEGAQLADLTDAAKAEKVAAGLDPNGDTVFLAKEIAPAGDDKVAITVPCAFDNGQEYELWVNGNKADGADWSFNKDKAGKITGVTIEVAPPANTKVLKFQVKAKAKVATAQN